MIHKFCSFCGKDTPHNPLKAPEKNGHRCTQCGHPRRPGQKNFGVILRPGGRVIMEAKP